MIQETFSVGQLACNCTILGDEDSKEAVVIDPGAECARILQRLAQQDLKAVAIVHTHGHVDHIGATWELAQATGATTYLHRDDDFLHQVLRQQALFLGMPEPQAGPVDAELADGGVIQFGNHELGVLHTPGHTPGSVCFRLVSAELCFSGDTLFHGSVGRTDLPGGDFDSLARSIRDKLYTMNSAVEVIPGHGQGTTIGRERHSNPFIRNATL